MNGRGRTEVRSQSIWKEMDFGEGYEDEINFGHKIDGCVIV
jgi:hypothetical protein